MRFKDKLKTIIYKTLRHLSRADIAVNTYNSCNKCKGRKRNWAEATYKDNSVLGHDQMMGEWIIFKDYNLAAKIQVMNEYIIDVVNLNEKLWDTVRYWCASCINAYMINYKEPENESR